MLVDRGDELRNAKFVSGQEPAGANDGFGFGSILYAGYRRTRSRSMKVPKTTMLVEGTVYDMQK
jgi:hypothetical protein